MNPYGTITSPLIYSDRPPLTNGDGYGYVVRKNWRAWTLVRYSTARRAWQYIEPADGQWVTITVEECKLVAWMPEPDPDFQIRDLAAQAADQLRKPRSEES